MKKGLCLTLLTVLLAAPVVYANPFFAFCMDTHDAKHRTLPEQAELLRELGYDGCGHLWLDDLQERLTTLDAAKLQLFQVYFRVSVAPGAEPYDARLKETLPLLRGRNVMLCLLLSGLPPADPAGEARAVELIRAIADMARDAGVRVVLYPHAGDWVEKVDDAVRVARKVERLNVGVMFNLCHFLKVDDEQNLRRVLESALPYLAAVSINGADTAAEIRAGKGNWLQPLDAGSFDQYAFLKTLKSIGYKGPVGLQCYGIEGDARDHLKRSIAEWRKLVNRLNTEQ